MTYRYKITRFKPKEAEWTTSLPRTGENENLVGEIQGLPASDLEERFARALDKAQVEYYFRQRISSPAIGARKLTREFANLPNEIEIDFLVVKGLVKPVFIDGQIAHFKAKWQADLDDEKTNQTNAFGRMYGWDEAVRIPYWKLENQDMTDAYVRQNYL